jgi:multiple sugar transport system substrate-binding protein
VKKTLSILLVLLLFVFAGCDHAGRPSPQNPVTLSIWHTYVEGMQNSFDELINEFNSTVGARNGITVKVTAIANNTIINENLIAAANKDPGALELPDMAVVYPKIAVMLEEKGVLTDLEALFSKDELSLYVPVFLEEGRLNGESLSILPIAKSTEVLYVNRTLFDRFALDTGVSLDDLCTFEGIVAAAEKYYIWSNGKTFFYSDNLFNYFSIGFQQTGEDFLKGSGLQLSSQSFPRIWDSYFIPATKGQAAIFNGYGNYIAITGDVVCYTSTSAGASFCPQTITYADNTKEDVVFDVLPYPVFSGGDRVAVQRGGGICVMKSDPVREYAAGLFLKWFTASEQNLRFTASTGYMPVMTEAFEKVIAKDFPATEKDIVTKTLLTTADMYQNYRFYYPPVFEGFDSLETGFVDHFRKSAGAAKEKFGFVPKDQVSESAYENSARDARTIIMNLYP